MMDEDPKPVRDKINLRSTTNKFKDIQHCGPNRIQCFLYIRNNVNSKDCLPPLSGTPN